MHAAGRLPGHMSSATRASCLAMVPATTKSHNSSPYCRCELAASTRHMHIIYRVALFLCGVAAGYSFV